MCQNGSTVTRKRTQTLHPGKPEEPPTSAPNRGVGSTLDPEPPDYHHDDVPPELCRSQQRQGNHAARGGPPAEEHIDM